MEAPGANPNRFTILFGLNLGTNSAEKLLAITAKESIEKLSPLREQRMSS